MLARRILAAALPFAFLLLASRGAVAQSAGDPVEKSFETADGVKLRGLFYKSAEGGGTSPTVLMLHEFKGNPNDPVWNNTAKLLAKKGYNVLQFDFRGHGKSTDVVANLFWDPRTPWGQFNLQNIQIQGGPSKAPLKNTINVKEFRPNYYPMLVQDVAAARNLLDLMNDTGEVNTSTIYMLGTGDAVNLGMLFVASEWLRERKKPNVPIASDYVSTKRDLFPGADPAGPDIGGAIWLSPAQHSPFSIQALKGFVISPYALRMRNETQMLFVHGEKDQRSSTFSNALFNSVLMAKSTSGPGGVKMPRPEQTFVREIKGSAAAGTKLLGNNLGTEKMIEDFLAAVDKERRSKPRKATEWDKPLFIDFVSFGIR